MTFIKLTNVVYKITANLKYLKKHQLINNLVKSHFDRQTSNKMVQKSKIASVICQKVVFQWDTRYIIFSIDSTVNSEQKLL